MSADKRRNYYQTNYYNGSAARKLNTVPQTHREVEEIRPVAPVKVPKTKVRRKPAIGFMMFVTMTGALMMTLYTCRVPSCKRVTAAYLSFGCKRCCKVSVCITTSAPAHFNRRRAVRCCDFNVSAANPARASRMSGFGARSGDSFGTDGCIRLCF